MLLISGKLVVTGVVSDIHYSLLNVLCLTVVHTILCLLRGFFLFICINWVALLNSMYGNSFLDLVNGVDHHLVFSCNLLSDVWENIFIVLLGLLLLRHGLPSHFLPEIQYLCTIFSYILCSNYIAPGSGE